MATTMLHRCAVAATARRRPFAISSALLSSPSVIVSHRADPLHRLGVAGVFSHGSATAAVVVADNSGGIGPSAIRPTLRGLSSSTTTTSGGGGVVITRASEDLSKKPDEAAANADGGGGKEESSPGPKMRPNPQQQSEERIMELQRHVRVHHKHANYGEALKSSRELLKACVDMFGDPFHEEEPAPPHPATASAYNNLGLMHKLLGEFDSSRENYDKALKLYGDVVGEDHASYAAALHNLGGLDRTQSTVDESLGGKERVELNERAAERFEGALKVREMELGRHHPHSVASRSSLGVAMAAAVLGRVGVAAEAVKKAEEEGTSEPETQPAPFEFSKESWEVAEKHLREAITTAIRNPRGEKAPAEAAKLNIKGKDRSKSGKERIKEKAMAKKKRGKGKDLLRGGRDVPAQAAPSIKKKRGDIVTSPDQEDEEEGGGKKHTEIRTLSAASAAQNLAVFLKSRADVALHPSNPSVDRNLDRGEMYSESIRLYRSALRVRSRLLREGHPDAVATKFSLAEAMEAVGEKDEADKLREQILGEYGVEEREGEVPATDDEGGNEVSDKDKGVR